ncbi:hypothetical protein [Stutzerimonas xanthomarina]|uniref:hypothetical protein n=1 Tax=Stutzerimonas xanthomarina TaxID=271420 RepID=UPI003AA7C7B7
MSLSDDSPEERFQLSKHATKVGLPSAEFESSEASTNTMPARLQSTKQIEGGSGSPQGQSSSIVKFVTDSFDLFHDPGHVVFCRDRSSGKVFALDSTPFRDRLQGCFYKADGRSPREQSVREALGTLAGIGRFESPCLAVDLRTAGAYGQYYLDLAILGNSQTVRIRAGCWDIVSFPEIMFIQPESMLPLPYPIAGGKIEPLWRLVNVPRSARLLVLTWLIDCLRPETPYPLLELIGEHGTAKSGTQRVLRCLIDPNGCNLRGVPRSAEDIFVAARASAMLSYENVSYLSAPMQDALCIVATGGGFAKRTLFSNFDESVIDVKCPIILNGIAASVTAQDLVDRTISIELPVIAERREASELWHEFQQLAPSLLGALLDIAAKALEILPTVQLPPEKRPRLLEYARLGMAVAQAMGDEPEAFLREFNATRQETLLRTIDESPVAAAIQELMSDRAEGVADSVKGLLVLLEKYRPPNCDSWPRSPKGLGDAMRRAAPALRQFGIQCTCLGKGSGGVVRWAISKSRPGQLVSE